VIGPEARLKELGVELPGLQPAMGNYLSTKRVDNLVFVSGHGPIKVDSSGRIPGKNSYDISVPDDLGSVITGKVGSEISLEEAREAARLTGLFLLTALRAEVGSLDRVQSVLKVFGMVNCAPGFTNTPAVIMAAPTSWWRYSASKWGATRSLPSVWLSYRWTFRSRSRWLSPCTAIR
jgi:hypothetical protein